VPNSIPDDFHEVKTSLEVLKANVSHISRAVDEVRDNMRNGLATKAEVAALEVRLAAAESTITWAVRLVIGGVITAAMAALWVKGAGK